MHEWICAECGKQQTGEPTVIEGAVWYCAECRPKTWTCSACGEIRAVTETRLTVGGETYCKDCFKDYIAEGGTPSQTGVYLAPPPETCGECVYCHSEDENGRCYLHPPELVRGEHGHWFERPSVQTTDPACGEGVRRA